MTEPLAHLSVRPAVNWPASGRKMPAAVYHGHRRRLRQRFMKAGLDGFHEYEILELILTYAIARKDTKPLAKTLIEKFGGLACILDASGKELLAVNGLGPRSAQLLLLLRPVCVFYLKERLKGANAVNNPEKVADYCRAALAGKGHEVVHVLFVDIKNRIIGEKTMTEGTIDESPVYPRRLVEETLACGAYGFILVHNHPSGSVIPSPADKALTKKIFQTAQAVELAF
ncbi:MAG: DNA repair protein RadC, partial [Elusimicrobia bacterium]|nr:DNA repair protein RadC [Elusimicrobiota bacterium]